MCDKVTGISMGFGFVNFDRDDSAALAVNALSGMQFPDGRRMRVSIARPAWKANIHSNLYVSGFPTQYFECDIRNALGEHGRHVEHIRVLRDSYGTSRGIAVLRFDTEENASDAMCNYNGLEISGGNILHVRPWKPEFRPQRADEADMASSSKPPNSLSYPRTRRGSLYVDENLTTRLDQTLGDLHPQTEFAGISSQLRPRRHTVYAPRSEPMECSPQLHLEAALSERFSSTTLVVFHLPPSADDDMVRLLFAPFGRTETIKVMEGKGYGFVSFFDHQDALRAMRSLNGVRLGELPIQIEMKTTSRSGSMDSTASDEIREDPPGFY